MAEAPDTAGAVPATTGNAIPVGDSAFAGDWRARLKQFVREPAFQRALPALVGVGVVAVLAVLYLMIAEGPQRILYSSLSDADRAKVVQTLEAGGIGYTIDNSTGALTVAETDVYAARMLVASDAGIASPEGASAMLDAIPLGSSRTLEGERLRLARERELMLTIREIDGIETVRVHLATPERSVFVREDNPPSASVMVRLSSGRSLSQSQVEAIVNLVSGSVPGMTVDHVRVVDQNGRLLSAPREDRLDHLLLQREFEAKLREQVGQLLLPLLGEDNFSPQVQVQLDQDEITSARESYDQQGAIRSESERSATRIAGTGRVGGVPGVPANTPPPDVELIDGPPEIGVVDDAADQATPVPTESERAMQRNYELGREVAVTSTRPGGLVKLSVAVAVSDAALEAAAPMTVEQLQTLVSAAVGADEARGDRVQVVVSAFEGVEQASLAFYEEKWFLDLMRLAAALLAIVLVLFLAVRPLIKRVLAPAAELSDADSRALKGSSEADNPETDVGSALENDAPDKDDSLPQKVELARQLAATQPDRAVEALRRMLERPEGDSAGAPAQ
ncbi:MAG: flagellar basal-body MS-ring/collar protein FliF [Pseudomonadota bacterium]